MKKILRALLVAGALAWVPSLVEAYKPMPCSQCSCYTQCGTLCSTSNGLVSACGVSGNWCNITPQCHG